MPWDQQSLRGWIGETVFSVISSSLYLHTNMVFLTFYIAICEFHQAFVEYFADLMKQIQGVNESSRVKLMLCNVIRYHISIKRYFQKNTMLFLCRLVRLSSPTLILHFLAFFFFFFWFQFLLGNVRCLQFDSAHSNDLYRSSHDLQCFSNGHGNYCHWHPVDNYCWEFKFNQLFF